MPTTTQALKAPGIAKIRYELTLNVQFSPSKIASAMYDVSVSQLCDSGIARKNDKSIIPVPSSVCLATMLYQT